MKIRRPQKQSPSLHPPTAQFIQQLNTCPDSQLIQILRHVTEGEELEGSAVPSTSPLDKKNDYDDTKVISDDNKQPEGTTTEEAATAGVTETTTTGTTATGSSSTGGEGKWPWPRTDLTYWIKALNRLDSVLEDIIDRYGMGNRNSGTTEGKEKDKGGKEDDKKDEGKGKEAKSTSGTGAEAGDGEDTGPSTTTTTATEVPPTPVTNNTNGSTTSPTSPSNGDNSTGSNNGSNNTPTATDGHIQSQPFTSQDQETLIQILKFQKMLLENSTNRKIWNGGDRLNSLLQTTDLTVLINVLLLSLRPSQQFWSSGLSFSSSNPSNSFPIDYNRLSILTEAGWGGAGGVFGSIENEVVGSEDKSEEDGIGLGNTGGEGGSEEITATAAASTSSSGRKGGKGVDWCKKGSEEEEGGVIEKLGGRRIGEKAEEVEMQFYRRVGTSGTTTTTVGGEGEDDVMNVDNKDGGIGDDEAGKKEGGSGEDIVMKDVASGSGSVSTSDSAFQTPKRKDSTKDSDNAKKSKPQQQQKDGMVTIQLGNVRHLAVSKAKELGISWPPIDGDSEEVILGTFEKLTREIVIDASNEWGIPETDKDGQQQKNSTEKNGGSNNNNEGAGSSSPTVSSLKRLELLQRVRISLASRLISPTLRKKLLQVRLLAIAVFGNVVSDSIMKEKLFIYEPDLVQQIGELVSPMEVEVEVEVEAKDEKGKGKATDETKKTLKKEKKSIPLIPMEIQTAALYALNGLSKSKHKTIEIASCLNAGVSHGILMYVVRKTIRDLDEEHPSCTPEFVDALFGVLGFLQHNAVVGGMMINAGIVQLLVELVKNTRRERLGTVTRAVSFLDTLLYSFPNAFPTFTSVGGLQVLINRIKNQVDFIKDSAEKESWISSSEVETPQGPLPNDLSSFLKAVFRSLHRIMTSSGTADGLRNLIDTSLVESIKVIMQNNQLFGAQIYSLAVNIMATFVHNEPTSLTVLQEAGLPRVFYDSVSRGIVPVIDVLSAIPNAVGALCLNEQGLREFENEIILTQYFAIFDSDKHIKVLQDRDNASLIGAALDELIRHQPSLKQRTFAAFKGVMRRIIELGKTHELPQDTDGYLLKPVPKAEEATDTEASASAPGGEGAQEGATSDSTAAGTSSDPSGAPSRVGDVGNSAAVLAPDILMEDADKVDDGRNPVLASIDVLGRVLEAISTNATHSRELTNNETLDQLLSFYSLPTLPYNFSHLPASKSLVSLFRCLNDGNPTHVLERVMNAARNAMNELRPFWGEFEQTSKLSTLLRPTPSDLEEANTKFRKLVNLQCLLSLLGDLYSTLGSRIANSVLQLLNHQFETQTLEDFGHLHRVCVWEHILLKNQIPSAWLDQSKLAARLAQNAGMSPEMVDSLKQTKTQVDKTDPKYKNAKALKHIVAAVPLSLNGFLQGIIKAFVPRRTHDTSQRKQAIETSKTIAKFMCLQLRWPDSADESANFSYTTLMIRSVSLMLIDDRPTSNIGTILLVAFQNAKGLEALFDLYRRYEDVLSKEACDASSVGDIAHNVRLVHVFGGLKVALGLLYRLSASKPLHESAQTGLLLNAQTQRGNEDFFEPSEFLVDVRSQILPVIKSSWDSTWLKQAPPNVVRNVVRILLEIIKAEGEETQARRVPAGPAGMAGTSLLGGIPPIGYPMGARTADENKITQLVDMGFPRSVSETALLRCSNNLNAATEWLLSHPGLVNDARITESRDQAQARANAAAAPADASGSGSDANVGADGGSGENAEGQENQGVENRDDQPAEGSNAPEASGSGTGGAPPENPDGNAGVDASDQSEAPNGEGGDATAVPGPSNEDVEMDDQASNADDGGDGSGSEDEDEDEDGQNDGMDEDQDTNGTNRQLEQAYKDLKNKLDEARKLLKEGLTQKILTLAEKYGDLVFDVKDALGNTISEKDDSLISLVNELTTISEDAKTVSPEKDAAATTRFRLLALLGNDASYHASFQSQTSTLMKACMSYLHRFREQPNEQSRWLAPLLLVIDSILVFSAVPKKVDRVAPAEAKGPNDEGVLSGPFFEAERDDIFASALVLLRIEAPNRDVFISNLRLLLTLTKDYKYGRRLVESGGIESLFSPFSSEMKTSEGCRPYVFMILRHVLEDPTTLQSVMERDLKQWFAQPRNIESEVSHLTRNKSALAGRDPVTFVKVVQRICEFPDGKADEDKPRLRLIKDSPAAGGSKPSEGSMDVDKAEKSKPEGTSVLETTTHFLTSELMRVTTKLPSSNPTAPMAKSPALTPPNLAPGPKSETTSADAPHEGEKPEGKASDTSRYNYACFLMACLCELVMSYPSCKISVLEYPRGKDSKDLLGSSFSKLRSAFVSFLLQDVIPAAGLGVISGEKQAENRLGVSSWACYLLVCLCYDPTHATKEKEVHPDVIHVRKVVLDSVVKAIKDAIASSESMETRYARLGYLGDLCYRLLTAPPHNGIKKEAFSLTMAKMMLEKNFVAVLTSALADADLNFPSVNRLIEFILRPIELLSRAVTKVGRAAERKMHLPLAEDDVSMSSDSTMSDEDMDDEDTDRDEASDLYRNSALGMYEGELEQGTQDEGGYTDEEYDDDDDAMEDAEEEVFMGSEMSDVSDEEDDENEDIHAEEEGGEEGDEDEEGSDDQSERNDDDVDHVEEGDDDGLDDEDGGDVQGGPIPIGDIDAVLDGAEGDFDGWGPPDGDAEDMDPDEEGDIPLGDLGGAFPHADEDDDDDDDDSSEEDDDEFVEIGAEVGAEEAGAAALGMPINAPIGMMRGHPSSLRPRLLDMGRDAVFGHQRPPVTTPDLGNHPLLVDSQDTANQAPPAHRHRRSGRNPYDDLLHSIEDALGNGAAQILQHILQNGTAETNLGGYRLSLTQGGNPNEIIAGITMNAPQHHHHHSRAGTRAPLRTPFIGTDGSHSQATPKPFPDLLPQPTLSRWSEEAKIHSSICDLTDYSFRATNHIINALSAKEYGLYGDAGRPKPEPPKEDPEPKDKQSDEEPKEAEAKTPAPPEAETVPLIPVAERAPSPGQRELPPAPEPEPAIPQASPAMEGVTMDDPLAQVMELARSLATVGSTNPTTSGDTMEGMASTSTAETSTSEAPEAPPAAEPSDAQGAEASDLRPPTSNEESNQAEASTSQPQQAPADTAEAPVASSSTETEAAPAPAERITVTINGNSVDITDTGIDPTFLEALPDDMREEVLNQHFREQRAAQVQPPASSSISAEFLNALPPEIRQEVLQQEEMEQRRRNPEPTNGGDVGGPTDMDPATFLATLDPSLRQQVLAEQQEDFISSLPPNLLAEATRGRDRPSWRDRTPRHAVPRPRDGLALPIPAPPPPKKPVQKEAVQLLDKAGVATLVRLLFHPMEMRKFNLIKVLVNLCENSKTRVELLNLLLTILHDGTRDVSTVDKSFSQMSIRASKGMTPKATPKAKATPTDLPGGSMPQWPGESTPHLVAQRCLDALTYLVVSNEHCPMFFLSEQELPSGLSRRMSKKGKGKEKATSTSTATYPLIFVLAMLNRSTILKTQTMMDHLTSLLSQITKPLVALKKPAAPETTTKKKEGADPTAGTAGATDATQGVDGAGASGDQSGSSEKKDEKEKEKKEKENEEKDTPESLLRQKPPQIPSHVLGLVVNILDTGECSSKTFQQTLALIQNLSLLPDGKGTISTELSNRAQDLGRRIQPELQELLVALNKSANEIRTVTLSKFSPASSLQAKLLRVLKVIESMRLEKEKEKKQQQQQQNPPSESPQNESGSGGEATSTTKAAAEGSEVPVVVVTEEKTPLDFENLWESLSKCLDEIQEREEDMVQLATTLLPLVEAFCLVAAWKT